MLKFYIISKNRFDDKNFAYGEYVDIKVGQSEKCQYCDAPISAREWLPPRKVKLSNPLYGDFVFGTFSTFLVSKNFKEKYLESEISGIKEFQPVEIVKIQNLKKLPKDIPQYYNVLIERSHAQIDSDKSNYIREGWEKKSCAYCKAGGVIKSLNGVYLLPNTWKGEDVFYINGLPGIIMASKRFYDFVNVNEFKNTEIFIPSEDYVPVWLRKKF